MSKSLKHTLGFLLVSGIMTCLIIFFSLDAIRMIVNKENIANSIKKINVEQVLESNSEEYEKLINKYAGSTDLLNNTSLTSTNLTQNDINQILNSEDYANILGSYIVDENIFEGIEGLEDDGNTSYNTESISKENIESLLKEIDIEYTDEDVDYLINSVPSVAPTVVGAVESNLKENVNKTVDNINLGGFYRIFSKRAMVYSMVGLVICVILLAIIYIKRYYFTVILALCSGAMCLISRVLAAMAKAILKNTPKVYKDAISVFASPLKKRFLFDFRLFLIITVCCVILYIILNLTITHSSIGSSIDFLHHMYETGDDEYFEDEEDLDDKDEFSDIDYKDIKVIDIDKEIDDF